MAGRTRAWHEFKHCGFLRGSDYQWNDEGRIAKNRRPIAIRGDISTGYYVELRVHGQTFRKSPRDILALEWFGPPPPSHRAAYVSGQPRTSNCRPWRCAVCGDGPHCINCGKSLPYTEAHRDGDPLNFARSNLKRMVDAEARWHEVVCVESAVIKGCGVAKRPVAKHGEYSPRPKRYVGNEPRPPRVYFAEDDDGEFDAPCRHGDPFKLRRDSTIWQSDALRLISLPLANDLAKWDRKKQKRADKRIARIEGTLNDRDARLDDDERDGRERLKKAEGLDPEPWR
ncbi:hypothetical protein ABQF26_01650 [Mycolicibacterium elephantis]